MFTFRPFSMFVLFVFLVPVFIFVLYLFVIGLYFVLFVCFFFLRISPTAFCKYFVSLFPAETAGESEGKYCRRRIRVEADSEKDR